MISKDAGIGIENDGNQKGSCQNPGRKRGYDAAACVAVFAKKIERIKEHRKKQQLHMLPGGFVDWGEQSDQRSIAKPFV
jgi:hypothetical protein